MVRVGTRAPGAAAVIRPEMTRRATNPALNLAEKSPRHARLRC